MKRLSSLALSMLITSAVMAQPRGPAGRPPDLHADARPLVAYLSLTAEQASVWNAIQMERRAAIEALHEQERAFHEQIDATNDAAEIGRLVLEQRDVKAKLDIARDAAAAKFAEILTSEQQVKFAALQQATAFLQRRGLAGPHPPRPR